jgi:hypothetical protein
MRFSVLLVLSFSFFACSKDSADDTGTPIDADGDGFFADEDCNDSDATIKPGADELCDENEVDEDCDGLINDADDNIAEDTLSAWYADSDSDGFGDGAGEAVMACADPSDGEEVYFADNTDCNDSDAAINPDAQEICDPDNVDEDCDGVADDEQAGTDPSTKSTWYMDSDSDGFGDAAEQMLMCDQPSGYVADDTDCNDSEFTANPGAQEICDGLDNDCNDEVDEDAATDVATWYADSDGDTYGDAGSTDINCDQPSGYVADSTDCDDTNDLVNPGAAEACDGLDTDCNAATSEDGLARFVDSSSNITDYASIGSSSAPDTTPPSSAGTLTLCDGTFYMNWDLVDDLTVHSLNEDETTVFLDGGMVGAVLNLGDYTPYGSGYSLDLVLEDLTVTNGYLASDEGAFAAGVSCTESGTASSITVENVVFEGNDGALGDGGGAVFTYGCDLDMTDVEVTSNASPYGAVFAQGSADLSITDSVFDSNESLDTSALRIDLNSAYSAALSGVDFYDNVSGENNSGGTVALTNAGSALFDDVAVFSNSTTSTNSDATSGVTHSGSSELEWTGSSSQTSGAWLNEDYGPGLLIKSGSASFVADVADFGGSSSNNADYDIDFTSSSGSAYYAPDDASFVCNNYRCGDDADGDGDASDDEETCEVGTTSNATHYDSYTNVLWGAVYLADTNATIESFDAYMSTTSGCTLDWYVLSSNPSSSAGGTWTWEVVWADTNNSVSTQSGSWQNSGHIGLPVESGTHYSLIYASSCSSTQYNIGPYYSQSSNYLDGGFGDLVGYVYDTALWADMNVGGSFSRTTTIGGTVEFLTRPHITDLDAPSAGVCP